MPKGQSMIGVWKETHKRIKRIAQANGRTLGGQVDVWSRMDCRHPVNARKYMTAEVSYPGDLGHSTTVTGFVCGICGQLVINEKMEG
jgi:hypothetical protein